MRIISGKYKGRILGSVPDRTVRPAMGRVKGTIFNMLQNRLNLIDADILDLFAGTGSLGFEAMSRGAARVVFVDSVPAVLDVIEENATMLGCLDDCDIIQGNADDYLRKTREMFDLIFADPPYAFKDTESIPQEIFLRKLLRKEGFLIIEHAKQTSFPESPLYQSVERREFGNTHVSFFTYRP